MSRLDRGIRDNLEAGAIRATGTANIPRYTSKGRLKRTPIDRKKIKPYVLTAGIVLAVALFIYFPQIFMIEENTTVVGNLKVNTDAISVINKLNSSDWTSDYDGDGLDNQEEKTMGTSQYLMDTDNDGISDYAEVYITKTSPISVDDTLQSNCILNDELKGQKLATPYKIGNVILWADDYVSKARGSVIETSTGYRIGRFNGYVQFTLYDGWYAYTIENGVHKLLPYRSAENVWHVSAGDNVYLYPQKLDELVEFTFFGSTFDADCNFITSLLSSILPDKGFVAAKKMTEEDKYPSQQTVKMADLASITYDSEDSSRFTKNCSSMNDIMYVRDQIDQNNCVAVTIFHENLGEKVGIIFGYYEDNTLLVADPETLEYVGNITITECAKMMIIDSAETVSYEYFTFNGFSASSSAGFRINFYQ